MFIIFVLNYSVLAAEDQGSSGLNVEHYYSITPKILENGTQNDISFGFFHTQDLKFGSEIKLRTIKTSELGEIWEIPDSMSTGEYDAYEVFLLPVNYQFIKNDYFSLRAGVGTYYNYNKSKTRGYFNDKNLFEEVTPDHYNSYNYDFTGHAVGPILDLETSLRWKFLYFSFSGGVVPVSYFYNEMSLRLSPLMTPPEFSVSGESASGPYYYLNLDFAVNFLKYFTLFVTLFNEFSRLKFNSIEFDDNGRWTSIDTTEDYNTFALEISLLVNLGSGSFMPLIGYGRTFDEETGGKNYFMLGVKKILY